ncbi:MAG: SDR family NAD(P)-dependent oxidoreductase [Caulobacteraceae bacterium]
MAGTALIIGGSGQIGQAACRTLLADGWRVIAAQRRPNGFPKALRRLGATTVDLDRDEDGPWRGPSGTASMR